VIYRQLLGQKEPLREAVEASVDARYWRSAPGLGAGQSSSAPAWEGASRSKTLATMSVV
jgi:hypothetical protein